MKDKRTGKIGTERHPLLLQMIGQGIDAVKIADELNVNQETVRKFARKRGIKITPYRQSMENHPMWKGGHTLDRSGYLLVRVRKDGEHGYLIRAIAKRGKLGTDSAGYAPVHRVVMHNKLGRQLVPGEVVDHIDGDIKNNRPENLRLYPSNAEHLKVTLKGKRPDWDPDLVPNIGKKGYGKGRHPNRLKTPRPFSIAPRPKTDGHQSL